MITPLPLDELIALLACPRHGTELVKEADRLLCKAGCAFPIVEGIPVMLLEETQQTIGIASASIRAASLRTGGPLYLDTIGLSDKQREEIGQRFDTTRDVDAVAAYLVGATSGNAYKHLVGNLKEYPIPRLPMGGGHGQLLLDVGCSWGRWTVSAARAGWKAIGIDPSLGAVLAASRAFSKEGASFVCGDARFLPFKPDQFAAVFSYSVLQHFSEDDATLAFQQLGKVLRSGGESLVQMAHAGGLRSTHVRTRKDYMDGGVFRVRYWSLRELLKAFDATIGPSRIRAEGFGGLGLLWEDFRIVSAPAKLLLVISQMLKYMAAAFPPLNAIADSVYVSSRKRTGTTGKAA